MEFVIIGIIVALVLAAKKHLDPAAPLSSTDLNPAIVGTPEAPIPVYDPPAPGPIAYPEAISPIPATPQEIDLFDDQISDQLSFDLKTGETKFLTVGETAIAAATGALGAAAGMTSTGVLIFSAAAWTVIGGIIAGVFVLVTKLISDTHLYANALVKSYENPFGDYWIKGIGILDNGWQDGTLSSNDVKAIYNALNVAWNNYRAAMFDLMGRSRDWEIVTKQSLNNLNNEFLGEKLWNGKTLGAGMGGAYGSVRDNGFITNWLNWTRGRIEYLESIGR